MIFAKDFSNNVTQSSCAHAEWAQSRRPSCRTGTRSSTTTLRAVPLRKRRQPYCPYSLYTGPRPEPASTLGCMMPLSTGSRNRRSYSASADRADRKEQSPTSPWQIAREVGGHARTTGSGAPLARLTTSGSRRQEWSASRWRLLSSGRPSASAYVRSPRPGPPRLRPKFPATSASCSSQGRSLRWCSCEPSARILSGVSASRSRSSGS
mmetsp:Transcript_73883/g.229868  ORF Transcript_73883/g.229868 Transcript_73883/m.229868 type:complete len:208 (-) Transcript_73883:63-686(-)